MSGKRRLVRLAGITGSLIIAFGAIVASAGIDFGQSVQQSLESRSVQQFGVVQGVAASSTTSVSETTAAAHPSTLATLGKGLKARVVTSGVAAPNLDMISLWPSDADPQWIIACNEEGPDEPGLQRIRISDGLAETILTGTDSCDPSHVTPWGTLVFGEEADGGPEGGRVYELIDPLHTTGVTLDRTTGEFSGGVGAQNFAVRAALGRNSFEGIAVYPNGVVYYSFENRPLNGVPGGAYFKFIPDALRDPSAGAISSLEDSPLASGTIYGLRLGLRSDATDYGQGSNVGLGTWVEIGAGDDQDLQALSADLLLTGYYRPEDIAIDGAALAAGNVFFCANNTGNEFLNHNYGETICVSDGSLDDAAANAATPEVQYLQLGNPQRQMVDNIAYQPGRGNWVLHEDADVEDSGLNDDLWDCLPDGADDDQLSDGCIRIATLNDLSAEWTGGAFDATGQRLFVSVQHNMTGYGVILEITGWK